VIAGEGEGEGRARLNTDDHPVIEFGFARNLGRSGGFEVEVLARRARELGADRPRFRSRTGVEGWPRAEDARLARGALFAEVPPAPGDLPPSARRAREAYVRREWAEVRAEWERRGEVPNHRIDLVALGEALAREGLGEELERAREIARRLDSVTPAESEALLALAEYSNANPRTSAFYLGALFARLRTDPWIEPDLVSTALRMAIRLGEASPAVARELYDALAEPFAVGLADQERLTTRLNLSADLRAEGGRGREEPACVEAFAAFEPWVPWSDEMLSARVSCYAEADSPLLRRALRELGRYRTDASPKEAPAPEDASAD
jgi:spermidine synthase